MSEVTDEGGTAGSVFADYPIKVGGKTGTAETYENGEAFDNGLFIAFARRSTTRRSSSAWSARAPVTAHTSRRSSAICSTSSSRRMTWKMLTLCRRKTRFYDKFFFPSVRARSKKSLPDRLSNSWR